MEPGKAFADIAARPGGWWLPMILVIITSITFIACYSQRVGWERMIRHEMETNSRIQQLPPEQREAAMERGAKFAGVFAYVGAAVGTPLAWLVVGGVLMLMMNSVMGGQTNFKQSFTIVAYASMVNLLAAILGIIVMFIKNPDDFDLRNPLAFNGGAFLSSDAPKWLTALASSFDLFTIWLIALLAIGYAATSRKLTVGKAATGIVVLWALWVVVKVGWTAAFS